LDTFVNYLRRHQVKWLCDWQSTRELEVIQTTIHIESESQDDQDTQVEIDTSTSADVAWNIAVNRCSWRALQPQLGKHD